MTADRLALFVRLVLAIGAGIVFGLAAGPAAAVDPQRSLAQLHHTAWTRAQGGPGTVRAITQAPDGFLWIGNATGLYRFDGVVFEPVRTLGGVEIASFGISALLALPDGGIWLSFDSGLGAAFYKDGRLTRYPVDSGLGAASRIVSDLDGHAWFRSRSGRLLRVPVRAGVPGPVQAIGADFDLDDERQARDVAVDPRGVVWITIKGRPTHPKSNLLYLPRGAKRFLAATAAGGNHLAISTDGTLWVTNGGFGMETIQTTATVHEKRYVTTEPTGLMLFDRRRALWVQTAKGIARVGDPKSFDAMPLLETVSDDLMTPAQGLSGAVVYAIFEDREGNVWLGTSGGLDRFRDTRLVYMPTPRREMPFAIVPGDDGAVYAANWDAGLLKATATSVRDLKGVQIGTTTLYRDPQGSVWAGATTGVWHTRPDDSLVEVPTETKHTGDAVRALVRDAQGTVWMAPVGGNGLWRRAGEEWVRSSPAEGFPERWLANALLTDARGRTWAAHGREILLIENGRARPMNAKALGLDVGDITTFYRRGERVWVVGANGLALFDGERFKALKNPGRSDLAKLTGMVETATGDLWLNGDAAALHLARAEVERGLGEPATALQITRYTLADGFRGTTAIRGPMPTIAEDSDGRIWYATDGGLMWIDPKRLARNTLAPRVFVRSVSFDGTALEVDGPADSRKTTPQVRHLEFAYTAASLAMPERVRFRYRLDGVDEAWQEAGTRRTAYYTNLDPGRYRFEVVAANEDGVWSAEAASVAFEVPPAWFQSWWFRLGCVALALLLLATAWRLRLRQIAGRARRRAQLQQLERERIARELHDTLLQSVTGLMLRFQAVADGLPKDGPDRSRMVAALDRADQVLAEGRDRVSSLRQTVNRSLPIEHALLDEGRRLADEGAAALSLTIDGTPREIGDAVRENLHEIMKEALTNAIRHADATAVRLHASYGWRQFALRVSDDGKGMPAEVLAQGRSGHWGLAGMRERAQAIGAQLSVRSAPGLGTTVELSLPARRAYAVDLVEV